MPIPIPIGARGAEIIQAVVKTKDGYKWTSIKYK